VMQLKQFAGLRHRAESMTTEAARTLASAT
jgi:hypothetical protein